MTPYELLSRSHFESTTIGESQSSPSRQKWMKTAVSKLGGHCGNGDGALTSQTTPFLKMKQP
jgi:hypothetical protein